MKEQDNIITSDKYNWRWVGFFMSQTKSDKTTSLLSYIDHNTFLYGFMLILV